MAEYTKVDALAFIDSMRILLGNRTGFKWMIQKLSDLAAYVESVTVENEQLHAYLDSAGENDDYEAYRMTTIEAGISS